MKVKKAENYYDPKLEKRMATFYGIVYAIVIALLVIKGLIWLMQ